MKFKQMGRPPEISFVTPSQGREISKQTGTAARGPSTRGQTHRKDHPSLAVHPHESTMVEAA